MNASRAVFVFVRASRASGASAVESGGGFSACHSLITQSLNLMIQNIANAGFALPMTRNASPPSQEQQYIRSDHRRCGVDNLHPISRRKGRLRPPANKAPEPLQTKPRSPTMGAGRWSPSFSGGSRSPAQSIGGVSSRVHRSAGILAAGCCAGSVGDGTCCAGRGGGGRPPPHTSPERPIVNSRAPESA